MRAALSILGLVVVLAIVLFNARQQARQLKQTSVPTAAAGGANAPEAVLQQVQGALDQAAARASDAQP
jgi:hypothetical protein